MGIDSHFLHRCDIKRPYSGSEDGHGLSDFSRQFAASGVRFRLIVKNQRIWKSEEAESAVITVYKGLFSPGVDLQERDRLVNVVMEDGSSLEEEFEIENILPRRSQASHHVSVELKRVS